MGGPEMAPQTPQRSERPGGAVALLCPRRSSASGTARYRVIIGFMTSLTAHGEPPRYFTFPALAAAGLPHASTTRHCPGVTSPSQPTSPFTADAHETLAAAGLDLARVAYARQV